MTFIRMKFERIRVDSDSDANVKFLNIRCINVPSDRASNVLKYLNNKYPLPRHLEHVKRIWRKSDKNNKSFVLLMILTEEANDTEDWDSIITDELELSTKVVSSLTIDFVPNRMPKDREEYERWRELGYWPTVFHEQKSILADEAQELELVDKIGQVIIPTILRNKASVMIIDPVLFIDSMDTISPLDFKENSSSVPESTVTPTPNDDSFICCAFSCNNNTNFSLLDEPVMAAIKVIAERQLAMAVNNSAVALAYLCTGYFVFCKDEPSLMSAMALVHSRARAVIFINPNSERGALSSRLKLHGVVGINHYFSVYKCTL